IGIAAVGVPAAVVACAANATRPQRERNLLPELKVFAGPHQEAKVRLLENTPRIGAGDPGPYVVTLFRRIDDPAHDRRGRQGPYVETDVGGDCVAFLWRPQVYAVTLPLGRGQGRRRWGEFTGHILGQPLTTDLIDLQLPNNVRGAGQA